MKRVIITGATGAIGNALIRDLVLQNIEVLVFIRADSERNRNIPEHPLVKKKICDLSQLAEVKNDTGKEYDVFYHLAWAGALGSGRDDMYLQNKNVQYTLDAVGVAQRFGCKTFIGAGSQAEYGRYEGVLNSSVPTFPENGYGTAKLCAGLMSRIECRKYGMKHIWTRILSIYGPYDSEKTMVSSTIQKLLNGEKPSLTLCKQQWDYLYCDDAAKALILLAEKGIDGKTYCIGSGEVQSLRTYVEIIKNKINPNAELGIGEIAYGERQVMYLQADISELKQDTGFEPEMPFEVGIENTIEWMKTRVQK